MVKDAYVHCRVSSETKVRLRALAVDQHLTESALLKRLLDQALFAPSERATKADDAVDRHRSERLYLRLSRPDRDLLQARAEARSMAEATYASLLLHSHLRRQIPLPKAELSALLRSIGELTAVARELRQLIRLSAAGNSAPSYTGDNARTMLKVCEALRVHTKSLLEANAASWSVGGNSG